MKAIRKAKRKRSRAAKARFGRKRKNNYVPKSAYSTPHRIAAGLEPGSWYAIEDIWKASGVLRNSVKQVALKMARVGTLERIVNPEYVPMPLAPAYGRVRHPDAQPKYLYRLSDAGLALREEAAWLA